MNFKDTLTILFTCLLPFMVFSQNKKNIIKYDIYSTIKGPSPFNLNYERYIFRGAISLEIGIAKFKTSSSLEFTETGIDTVVNPRLYGKKIENENGYIEKIGNYNPRGLSIRMAPKVFPLNFRKNAPKNWFRPIREGFYIQPHITFNTYQYDYFNIDYRILDTQVAYGGAILNNIFNHFFGTSGGGSSVRTTYERTINAPEVGRETSFNGWVNLGFQTTFARRFHIDISLPFRPNPVLPVRWTQEEKGIFNLLKPSHTSRKYENIQPQIKVGIAF